MSYSTMGRAGGGRASSQISIYDYPEHLNPFYEEDNHKRLRFWHLGRKSGSGKDSRRGSFTLDGLKEMWAFKSFKLKKRSSVLGINKTSESPPPLRRTLEPHETNYGTYDPRMRHTVGLGTLDNNFQRNATYRSSLQDMRSTQGWDNNSNGDLEFTRNNRYRRTMQSTGCTEGTSPVAAPRRYVYGGSVTPQPRSRYSDHNSIGPHDNYRGISRGSSQTSLTSTNPFEDDDDETPNVSTNLDSETEKSPGKPTPSKRTPRKKRRAPPPPVPIPKQIDEESTSAPVTPLQTASQTNQSEIDENAEIANLTAEIESFVKTTTTDSEEIETRVQSPKEKTTVTEVTVTITTATPTNEKESVDFEERPAKLEIEEKKISNIEQSNDSRTEEIKEENKEIVANIEIHESVKSDENLVIKTEIEEQPKNLIIKPENEVIEESTKKTVTKTEVEVVVEKTQKNEKTEKTIEPEPSPKLELASQPEKTPQPEQTPKPEQAPKPEKLPKPEEIFKLETPPKQEEISKLEKPPKQEETSKLAEASKPEATPKQEELIESTVDKSQTVIKENKKFTVVGHEEVKEPSPEINESETLQDYNDLRSFELRPEELPAPVVELRITESKEDISIKSEKSETSETSNGSSEKYEIKYVPLKDTSSDTSDPPLIDKKVIDSVNAMPPEKRRSVKDIIASINRSQSLLKVNQEAQEKTENSSIAPPEIRPPPRKSSLAKQKMIENYRELKRTTSPGDSSSTTNGLAEIAEGTNGELNNNSTISNHNYNTNDIFKKCVVKKEFIRESSPTASNLDWNPLPKPKRTKNLSELHANNGIHKKL